MMGFGKQGASPNPLQRDLIGRPILTRLLFVALFCIPFPVYLVFAGFWDAAAIAFLVSAVPGYLALHYSSPKLDRLEEWNTEVPYLPWPRSWPGWRDTAELLAAERQREKGLSPDQFQDPAPLDEAPSASASADRAPSIRGVVKRGLSPNPVQKLLLEKPWYTPLCVSGYLVLPMLFFVAPNGGLLLALEIYLGALILITVAFWFTPSRKLTRDERWDTEAVLLPWPKSWPGWRSTEDLLKEQSVGR